MKTKIALVFALACAFLLAPTATAQTLQIKAAPSMSGTLPPLKDRQLGIATDTKRLWIGLTYNGVLQNYCLNFNGKDGKDGTNGVDGAPATVSIGTVSSTASGTQPTVTGTGTATNRVLNFTFPLPQNGANGNNGATPTLTIGATATLSAGSPASANFTGTAPNYVLNLGLPAGPKGDTGAAGASGASLIRVVRGTAVPATLLGALNVPGLSTPMTVTFPPYADADFIAKFSFRRTAAGLLALDAAALSIIVDSQTASSVTFRVIVAGVPLVTGRVLVDVETTHTP